MKFRATPGRALVSIAAMLALGCPPAETPEDAQVGLDGGPDGGPRDAAMDAPRDASRAADAFDARLADVGADGGSDGGPDSPVPTYGLADYVACSTSDDCRGVGECITSVTIPNGAGGTTDVPIATVFPAATRPGVCSRICTGLPDACDGLVQDVGSATPIPFTCHLVYAAASPYPDPAPAFPFTLDVAALGAGVRSASLCRPSFGPDAAARAAFCAPCTASEACGGGVCVDLASHHVVSGAPGMCMARCSDGACPLGFACEDTDGAQVCIPAQRTCTDCRDVDADGFGVGNCASTGRASAVDCDDTNPTAHFLATAEACGVLADLNCNGAINEENASGCNPYFRDVDGDSYGQAPPSRCFCTRTAPWTALVPGDCNDGRADAFPGSPATIDAAIDMNCDGAVTHVWTAAAYCDAVSCLVGVGTDGWNLLAGGEPACGVLGQWGGCRTPSCAFGARRQMCR